MKCIWGGIDIGCYNENTPPIVANVDSTVDKTVNLAANTTGKSSGSGKLSAPRSRPEPCEVPACNSKKDMLKFAFGNDKSQSNKTGILKKTRAASNLQEKTFATTHTGCPADREELGRQSWTLLHTIAAYYPDKPNEVEKKRAKQFVNALSHMYPCKQCAYALREEMKDSKNGVGPVNVDSRTSFSKWMCRAHNSVNTQLGKPIFSCDIKVLDERWREGKAHCWVDDENETASESLGHENP